MASARGSGGEKYGNYTPKADIMPPDSGKPRPALDGSVRERGEGTVEFPETFDERRRRGAGN